MSYDPQAVRAFEHVGWQKAASGYGASFAHATAEYVEALLDAARIGTGMRLLDLCCGPGLVAAAAAQRGAFPIGADFSAAMLELARSAHPQIRFDEGDAESLPYEDHSFDAVVSNFGLHHVPEPGRALAEAHRVLRPGGRVAFTSWAAPERNIAWKLLFDAVAAHGDPNAAQAPPSGGGLRRPDDATRLLQAAGFAEIEARTAAREWRLDEPGGLVEGFRRGTVRTAAVIEAQPRAVLPAIEAAIAAGVAPYRRGNGYAVPILAILARAVRP